MPFAEPAKMRKEHSLARATIIREACTTGMPLLRALGGLKRVRLEPSRP